MSKNTGLLLIAWNIALTALAAWGLLRSPAPAAVPAEVPAEAGLEAPLPAARPDTAGRPEARIAYFHMDSLRDGYELIKEKDSRYIAEGRRLEAGLQAEQAKARERYQQLMSKDHTYSTKAEGERDEAELRGLMEKLQGMQAESEERLARLEADMLKEIAKELDDYLKVYNAEAGYDYILSVQSGGQIWVGNQGLNITQDLLNGLNARYRAAKAAKK